MRTILSVLCATAALLCLGPIARGADDGVGARHWNMKCGGADRTSRVTCEPIRRQPIEAWRIKPEGAIVCEPVVWGGTIFLVSRDTQGRNVLLAYDAATGEQRARKVVLKSTDRRVNLLAWQGTVVMTERETVRAFLFKGTSFKAMWKKAGDFSGHPGICGDLLLVPTSSDFSVYGLRRGKELTATVGGSGLIATTYPRPQSALLASASIGNHFSFQGDWLRPRLTSVEELHKRAPTITAAPGDNRPVTPVERGASSKLSNSVVARMDGADGSGWFFWCKDGFAGAKGALNGALVPDRGEGGLADARVAPAIFGGQAYTFNEKWDLLKINVDGRYFVVVEAKDQPKGAWRGRPSIAQNVAYFGNWAVDLTSKRVLWVHDFGEDIKLPAIPSGDGLVVVRTKKGELVCLASPDAARGADADAATATAAAEVAVPPLPRAMDGVLLRDGSEVAGTVTQKGEDFIVTTKAAPRTVAGADVLVARSGGEVLHAATQRDVFDVLRRAARATAVRGYEQLFERAVRMEIPNAAGGVLEEARAWGMSERRAKELNAQLTGKRMHPNANLRLPALERRQGEAEAAMVTEILAAAKWCIRRELKTAAAGLLSLATKLDANSTAIAELAATTIPKEFPDRGFPDAPQRWLQWAPYVLAADAQFLGADDPAWKRCEGVWTRVRGTIGFRTPRLLLFSRSQDASIIGPCLRSGEAAVEGLMQILGDGPARGWTDKDRLDVRIHRNRKEYLIEKTVGGTAPKWSAGYYAPYENISRFHVPDGGPNREPLGRGLFKVLAHELTHHYVDSRWIPSFGVPARRGAEAPGFWIVEGLARFIEDQMVDADTRGLTFNDQTVGSIDSTAQMTKDRNAFPLKTLVDMTQGTFARLSDLPKCEVTLRRSLQTFKMSPRSIFYEQSGALAFWLLRMRGDKSRVLTIRYIRDFYTGRSTKAGWKRLGFTSAGEMGTAFAKFLQTVR